MAMTEYTAYNVDLRRKDTGEDLSFVVTASSPERAKEQATDKARRQMATMADRGYAQFEVVSCVVATART
jgi:hypothetical protein